MNKLSKILMIVSLVFTLTMISSCKKTYILTYDADGGKLPNGGTMLVEEYKKGSEAVIINDVPTKEGYKFIGWSYSGDILKSGDSIEIKENVTLNAKYEEVEEVSYTVTFKDDLGNIVEEIEVLEGEDVELINAPLKDGYTFEGWKNSSGTIVTEITNITSDLELIASYIQDVVVKETFTVTYVTSGGAFSDGSTTKTETYEEGSIVSLISDVPTKEGKSFIGWSYSGFEEIITEDFELTKNVVLVANYGDPMYTITYRAVAGEFPDGTKEQVLTVKDNALFEYISAPANGDRLFNGWYDNETDEFIEPGSPITSDMVVKAKYKRAGDPYNITLNLNGGISPVDEVITYYEGLIFVLPTPTKDGFEFLGWCTKEDLSDTPVLYQNDECEENKVYYAKWNLVDKNYARVIFDELVPDFTNQDLYLPTSYQGTTLFFTSSDSNIMTARGVIDPTHKQEVVTVSAQIKVGDEYFDYEKEVTVAAIMFEDMTNPVGAYFQTTTFNVDSEIMFEHLDIVYYAFAHVSTTGGVTVNQPSKLTQLMNKAVTLRKEKSMRFVLSIAGGADNFAAACANGGYVKVADNIIDIILKYNMDGVDIDWEFPATATDKENMYRLCENLRIKLDNISDGTGSPYLVTAAIPSHSSYTKFNLRKLNDVLDYVNMMSYDMNLEGRTTHLCPLHKSIYDSSTYAVSYGIELFTKEGFDKNKIIIGAAFYGKSYKVKGQGTWHDTYPGISAPSEYIHLEYASGTVTYKYLYRNILNDENYKRYYDPKAMVPYLYNETEQIFITYEDEESLIAKVDYAYQEGLGVMFWEYNYDYQNILTDTICNRVDQHKNGTIE